MDNWKKIDGKMHHGELNILYVLQIENGLKNRPVGWGLINYFVRTDDKFINTTFINTKMIITDPKLWHDQGEWVGCR